MDKKLMQRKRILPLFNEAHELSSFSLRQEEQLREENPIRKKT